MKSSAKHRLFFHRPYSRLRSTVDRSEGGFYRPTSAFVWAIHKNDFRFVPCCRSPHPPTTAIVYNDIDQNFIASEASEMTISAPRFAIFGKRSVSTSLQMDLALDALEQALLARKPRENLIHHSDVHHSIGGSHISRWSIPNDLWSSKWQVR